MDCVFCEMVWVSLPCMLYFAVGEDFCSRIFERPTKHVFGVKHHLFTSLAINNILTQSTQKINIKIKNLAKQERWQLYANRAM